MDRVPRRYYASGRGIVRIEAGILESGPTRADPRTLARTLQEGTFVLSIIAQITGLVFAIVALAQPKVAPALITILVRELIVQGVEIAWYVSIWCTLR